LVFAPALFVMGAGSGAIITPNQALTLMEVDPVTGSTAGGVLQTAQRMGLAVGQAVIGAVFFASIPTSGSTADRYDHALGMAILTALGFVILAAAVGCADLLRNHRRTKANVTEPAAP
jgi:MFS family permease